jgi:nitrite reductase/ring-hydroxylating ferredoxin subunit
VRNSDAQPVIRTLLEHLAARRSWRDEPSSVPTSAYTCPDHLAAERASLFRRWPQAVALTPDLPEPGSSVTRDGLGLPVVLTRDEAGDVHALVNVCAHRSAQVAPDGRACGRRLTCPYHAWSYGLDGSLRGVPDADAFPSVAVPGPGMRSLPCVESDGVIWVVPDPDAEAFRPELGGIADDLDHYRVAEHRHWRTHRFDLAMNWKLVVDTFLEPYHFASLHRNTVGPLFVPNLCVVDSFGPHLREVLPRRGFDALAEQPPESWDLVANAVMVYVLFPNTVFVQLLDHIETWRVYPDPVDPGRSRCDLDFYVPDEAATPESDAYWEKNWQLTIDTVRDEDFAAMAGVQRGLAAGVFDELRVGANEPAVARFHRSLDTAMTAAG